MILTRVLCRQAAAPSRDRERGDSVEPLRRHRATQHPTRAGGSRREVRGNDAKPCSCRAPVHSCSDVAHTDTRIVGFVTAWRPDDELLVVTVSTKCNLDVQLSTPYELFELGVGPRVYGLWLKLEIPELNIL